MESRIKQLREKRGLIQEILAVELGITQQMLSMVYHLRHPWKKWKPRLGRLIGFGISFVAGWAVRQARFGACLSPDLGHIIHWNSHT